MTALQFVRMLKAVVAPPKLSPKRQWLQFSLRTSFLIVSVACLALSQWIVPIEQQRRAVAAIEALGGIAAYLHEEAVNDTFRAAV